MLDLIFETNSLPKNLSFVWLSSVRFLGLVLLFFCYEDQISAHQAVVSTADWQSQLSNLSSIQNLPLLSLIFPGTHDTLTFDLSTTFASNANNLPEWLANILHYLPPSDELGAWVRKQAITQKLDVYRQLEAGVRFLDLRIDYSRGLNGSDDYQWYGLHTLLTKKPALEYLHEIRRFLDSHPGEFVFLWFSYHSGSCHEPQYPDATVEIEQKFWKQIETVFSNLLFDRRIESLNQTSLRTLLERNHRVVIFASDYANFTNSSPLAFDACSTLETKDPPTGVLDEPWTQNRQISGLQNGFLHRQKNEREQKVWQAFWSTSTPIPQLVAQGALLIDPEMPATEKQAIMATCAKGFSIPGMDWFCPEALFDIIELSNYYTQRVIYYGISKNLSFPVVVYLGAISEGGSFLLGKKQNGQANSQQFAFVPSLIVSLLQKNCLWQDLDCLKILHKWEEVQNRQPLDLWDDPSHGRLVNWPKLPHLYFQKGAQ